MLFGQTEMRGASRWLRLINAVIDYFGFIRIPMWSVTGLEVLAIGESRSE